MIALLLALGCASRTENHCAFTERPVADDERLDLGYTVEHIFAKLDPQAVDAVDLQGNVVPIEVTVTRAEGEATLTDAEIVEERVSGVGPAKYITWLPDDRPCEDVLAVPVTLSVVSDDGGTVGVYGDGTLTSMPWYAAPERSFELTYALQETDALPTGLHGAAEGGTLHAVFQEGVLVELGAEIVATDGAIETVLWFGEL